jgi:hypothetical protein
MNQCVAEEQLEFDFEFGCPSIEAEYYREGAQDLICRLVPPDLLEDGGDHLAAKRARFADMLPLIASSELKKAPCAFSILLLCKYRLNACHFFYDMISRWLLPNKRVNVELFFASDVRLPHLSEDLLSVAEIVIYLKSAQEVEEARRNMHQIETEIRLGVVSHYHARRILEFKGLSTDGKTAMIQEKISSLIQSHSKDFDTGIFSQMQQFLVTCPEDFKNQRDYHHISRIISNLHALRKFLKQGREALPAKRHISVKFFKTHLSKGRDEKIVLGILMGLNFLSEHEVFTEEQLMSAVRKQIPTARLVEGSSFSDRITDPGQETLYLEIEKADFSDFNLEEVQQLRFKLPDQIKAHIEQLARPIFMPRNDEEVLRNIMALSRQLHTSRDIPQVIISFEEQKNEELLFTVILLRLIEEGGASVQTLLAPCAHQFKYIPDRVRHVGQVRRKIKEASVFRVAVVSSCFLRSDRSIDLYKARSHVLKTLTSVFGEVRDYNGGMIYKHIEQINSLKAALGRLGESDPLLIEKFFYSLAPLEMRTSMDTESLKQLFLLLTQAAKPDVRKKDCVFKQDARRVMVVFSHGDSAFKKHLSEKLEPLAIPAHQLVSFSFENRDLFYTGYLLMNEEKGQQEAFLSAIYKSQ